VTVWTSRVSFPKILLSINRSHSSSLVWRKKKSGGGGGGTKKKEKDE